MSSNCSIRITLIKTYIHSKPFIINHTKKLTRALVGAPQKSDKLPVFLDTFNDTPRTRQLVIHLFACRSESGNRSTGRRSRMLDFHRYGWRLR